MDHTDSRIGEFSVFPFGFRDPSIGMSTLDGGELAICSRDARISGYDEAWLRDIL